MPGAEKSIDVNTSAEVLFSVIADYEKYPEFLKDIESAKIVKRGNGVTEAKFAITVVKRVEYTLRLHESPPNEVRWELVESNIMTVNNGGWKLETLGENKVRAHYRLEVGLPRFLPVPGSLVDKLTGQTLPATLEAFKKRAESMK